MEPPNDWTATALFSPSKALAQQAQAKDWASVDSWLSKKYASKRLPPFERNEDTLQALLTLATLNDGADEQRSLIDRIEKASLQALSRRKAAASGADDGIFELVIGALEGSEAFEALAALSVGLNCPDSSVETIGKAIVELTEQRFTTERQARQAETEVHALKSEQDRVSKILEYLQRGDDFEPPPDFLEMTSQWHRNTKQFRAKVGEYDDRLAALGASPQPSVRLEDIAELSEDLSTQQTRLTELNTKLEAFRDLPSNPKAARAQLESARSELRSLVRERDNLFENLVSNG